MSHALHFLVDASLLRATVSVIQAAGHQATDLRDIGLGTADDQQIADHAKANDLCLITRDGDFGNILNYPPQDFAGIVVIDAPEPASRDVVLRMVVQFLQQTALLRLLGARLVIVEAVRIQDRRPNSRDPRCARSRCSRKRRHKQ